MVEYRWHPLYGRRLRLYRRTKHDDDEVVHVEVERGLSRELPSWMVDASICRAMDLGPPQLSVAALLELREIVRAQPVSAGNVTGCVSSMEGDGSCEAATKSVDPAVSAANGVPNDHTTGPGGAAGSNQHPRRPVTGSARGGTGRASRKGGPAK